MTRGLAIALLVVAGVAGLASARIHVILKGRRTALHDSLGSTHASVFTPRTGPECLKSNCGRPTTPGWLESPSR